MGKKKKAADTERVSVLDNALLQHKYHIGRLEQMLRLLDNNDLAPDQVGHVVAAFLILVISQRTYCLLWSTMHVLRALLLLSTVGAY